MSNFLTLLHKHHLTHYPQNLQSQSKLISLCYQISLLSFLTWIKCSKIFFSFFAFFPFPSLSLSYLCRRKTFLAILPQYQEEISHAYDIFINCFCFMTSHSEVEYEKRVCRLKTTFSINWQCKHLHTLNGIWEKKEHTAQAKEEKKLRNLLKISQINLQCISRLCLHSLYRSLPYNSLKDIFHIRHTITSTIQLLHSCIFISFLYLFSQIMN